MSTTTRAAHPETAGTVAGVGKARRRIGVGVIGFVWLGHAHSRSLRRIPMLFPDRTYEPELVACSDTVPARVDEAVSSFGFTRGSPDWRTVIEDPDVDAVFIAAPNMLHVELIEAAAAARKQVFCEKPVGGTPEQVLRAARAARAAGVISGVGYNHRWAPLVQYARELIETGEVGEITNYRGRFFSGYMTVLAGDRFPHHGAFVPGAGNAIGFEDLIVIEDHEFCRAVAEGRPYETGFDQALAFAAVQAALLHSVQSGAWEDVVELDAGGAE